MLAEWHAKTHAQNLLQPYFSFYHLSTLLFKNPFSLVIITTASSLFFTGALSYLRPEITWSWAPQRDICVYSDGNLLMSGPKSCYHLPGHILCSAGHYIINSWWRNGQKKKKEGTTRRNIRPKTVWLWTLLHQSCRWTAEMSALNVVGSVEFVYSATKRHFPQKNPVTKHHLWTLPVESLWGQRTQIYRHRLPAFWADA